VPDPGRGISVLVDILTRDRTASGTSDIQGTRRISLIRTVSDSLIPAHIRRVHWIDQMEGILNLSGTVSSPLGGRLLDSVNDLVRLDQKSLISVMLKVRDTGL
jgi:hypothetical protein